MSKATEHYDLMMGRAHDDRMWHPVGDEPSMPGWYEVRVADDRWQGQTRYRAWGQGRWWTPLGDRSGEQGWMSSPAGYEWRGPAHDIMGRSPATDEEMADRITPRPAPPAPPGPALP